jgi:hypothetical protein
MATSDLTTPVLEPVKPGDLITADLINNIINLLPAPTPSVDLPQISNVYALGSNGKKTGNDMTVTSGSAAVIEGSNLDSVYLVRFDSVPVSFEAQADGSLQVTTVPIQMSPTNEPDWRQAIGLVAITNPAGTGQRIVVYASSSSSSSSGT